MDGEGGNSERCLKWDGGGGVIKESFQKHLKIGGGYRQKLSIGGSWRCHLPAPPQKF